MRHARADYERFQDPEHLIPEDEPVFLIRAQDIASGDTLRFWALKMEHLKADPEVIRRAREWAQKMDAWPKKKVPDLP